MALFVASAFVGNAGAQTDVTSTYLMNADFEGEYSRFLDINTDRGVEKPFGWSVEWYQDNSDKNGMTYVAESMKQDGITWSGKSGKSYFARMRWGNATLYLRQTLQNLRPGDYTLSFSVSGHTTNATKNSVQVSVAGQTQLITLGNNENGNWADYSIKFSITGDTPYATVEFKAVRGGDLLKIGVDEFKLMYDGSSYYESIISKAQALYDNNKDWAENGLADFETAISDNKGKQTIAEINEAIVALEKAMATFKSLNSVDVTVKINNPNFDSNIDGWTKTGGDGNGFQRQTSTQPNFAGGFLERWRNAWNGGYNQKDFDVYQEISNLPSGEYTVNAYIQAQMQGGKETLGDSYKDKKHGGPYYIDNNKGVWMYATSGDNSSNVWANTHNPNFGETGGGVLRTASVKVTNGVLKIGFKGIGSPDGGTQLGTYANWIACDTWTLNYFGFDPTTLLAQLSSLTEEANSLLNSEDYKNVGGIERTELTIATNVEPEETKVALETAVAELEKATATFTAAKSSYDALVAAIANAEQAGINTTTAQGVLDAETTTATGAMAAAELLNAEVKVKDASADIPVETDFVANGTFDNNTNGWTTTTGAPNKGTATNQTGDFTGKFWENWSGSNYQGKMYQTINNIPNGTYKLKIAAFVSVFDANMSAQYVYANSEKTYLMLGAPTYYEVFTYVNNNTIEIGFEQTGKVNNWSGIDNVTLTYYGSENIVSSLSSTVNLDAAKKGANDAVSLAANVTGTELTDVNTVLEKYTEAPTDIAAAIAEINAKASVLRKAIPSYDSWKAVKDADYNTELPYASSEKLEAFKTSLDAEPTSASEADAQSASITTAYRQYVESNALAEGVAGAENLTNLITNPNFGEGKQDGWVSSQTGGDLNIYNSESFTDGDGKADYYYFNYNNNGGNNQSISQKITLPAGKYIVTATLRGAAAFVGNFYMTANKAKTSVPAIGNTGGVFGRGWNDVTLEFTNEQAGDVEIKVYTENGKNGWWGATRFRLVKIADAATMSISDAQYSTFIAPFDIEIPEGVTASKITGVAENGSTLIEEAITGTILANTPVLLYSESALTQTFYGQSTATADTYTEGLLTGVYVNTEVPVGSYVLLNKNNQVGFYEVVDAIPTVKRNRCYLTVTGSTAPMFSLERGEGTTSIEEAELTNENIVIYDLAGRRVEKMEKGIYIVNGKKVIR